MKVGRDAQGTPSPRRLRPYRSVSWLGRLAAVALVSVAVAACSSSGPTRTASTGRAEVDPKLGVAPSPRVVKPGERVPKGGGRAMLGRPYTIGGKRYVPSLDPDYEKVGLASWYGDAFHGRRTANGEIFDSNHLSAAHPTMPLPSYARVTSMTTGRSVIVRVNDRGPFHSSRVIDISRRTAELLGVKRQGIAKVKVEYVGPAPTEGDDTRYLMASLRGAGDLPSDGGFGETMMASAGSLPGVASVGATISAAASVFSSKPAPAAPAQVAPAPVAAPGPAVDPVMIAGTVLPPTRPLAVEPASVSVAMADPAVAFMAAGAPIQVAALTPAPGALPPGFTIGAQPVSYQSDPLGVESVPMPSSYAADRIATAYAAVADAGEGVPLADLARSLEALAAPAEVTGISLEVGVFGDLGNVRRAADALSEIGTVAIDALVVGGRPVQRVRVVDLTVGEAEALVAARRIGAADARIVR